MQKVKFQVKADKGRQVFVAGSFNQWDPTAIKMKRSGDGCYAATVELSAGRHEYKFMIDGAWQCDQACQERVANTFGSQNNVIEVR
ncbi:MAG: glycogen-binding domain-containing protein [Kiritimatiellae bacterium]|nr:glycogen-binding domain-containing protein [Kiritimatiellia bacterium]